VLLTPSWVAGILGVGPRLYIPVNTAAAAMWAIGIGLGAYFIGPSVVDIVGDIGWVTGAGVALLVLGGVATEITRRRRRSAKAESQTTRTS
jgi:membrane protein DedA with SNARE-associated domain